MNNVTEILRSEDVRQQYGLLPADYRAAFEWRTKWLTKAHKHQIVPPGEWWAIWLLQAGRGAGKTRTAAEQVGWWAWSEPKSRWLVAAPTSSDVRGTCFEGDSGLINVIPQALIKDYNKSLHELTLTNGSLIKGIPASEPERFRGAQWHGGWCFIAGTMISMADGTKKPIERIVAGDMVLTRHGARKVIAAGLSGNPKELVRLGFGVTSLTGTIDHPILVNSSWTPMGDLKEGDLICLMDTSKLEANERIELSGNGIMGQSQKVGLSITRTRIGGTTIFQTLRQCLAQITIVCIRKVGQSLNGTSRSHPNQTSVAGQKWNGGQLSAFNVAATFFREAWERLASFVVSIVRPYGVQMPSGLSFANASNAGQITSQRNVCSFTVQKPVIRQWQASDTSRKECPLISHALNVGRSFKAKGKTQDSVSTLAPSLSTARIRSVERLPNCQTYNLTVEGEHEYIANGVVVHNCDELAAWDYIQDAWDQIMLSVRLGARTRVICTTTPKPKDLLIELNGREGDDVAITRASTHTNLANLSPTFQKQILQYEGTKLGRQEIYAEIIDPEEGGIVKREWFQLWPAEKPLPKFEYIIQSYDCATSDKTANDPTACIVLGIFKPLDGPMAVMVIDVWNERLQYPDLRPKVIAEYDVSYGVEDGKSIGGKKVDLILVEDKSAGISLIQDLQRAYLPVQAYNPGRADKTQRLSIVANIIQAKRVWIPESSSRKGYVRDWAEGFVSQICSFPDCTHDDMVDAASQGLRYLRDAGWLDIDPAPRYDDDDYVEMKRQSRGNPYAQ
jgi:phage terminase large subunit-like protein